MEGNGVKTLNKLNTIVALALLSMSVGAQEKNVDIDYLGPAEPAPALAPTAGFDILYAPSESDDPAFRAAIEAFVDGNVDYWDARSATPSLDDLEGYECVMTWANFAYEDNETFGDNLAAFADAGGSVVLGAFAAYTSGNFLSGDIMGPGYSPVTGGLNHFSDSAYAGDGVTAIHDGVTDYDATFRDILTLQGGGVQDGSYEDDEIAAAYQPGVAVVYANGAGGQPIDGDDKDHPRLVANACQTAAEPEVVARFNVTKTFSDGIDAEVDVMLSCNTGLPLEQTFTIAGGDPEGVTFVVTEIGEAGATCEVTESGAPDGYTTVLNGGDGCTWEDVTVGYFSCEIDNVANPATYTVEKEWAVFQDGGDVVIPLADVLIECDSVILNDDAWFDDGTWYLSDHLGDGESLMAYVDVTDESATCSATEDIDQSGVESVALGCSGTTLSAGGSHTCTFTNTVFFEGIPTLSQYGLALLVLLTLGVGFVGLRRFV
jgi:hypothetical protein